MAPPELFYCSGEPIRPGDVVSYAGSPGRVRFVLGWPCDEESPDAIAWYMEEFGGGFMLETRSWGLILFERADEDLELVSRAHPA